MPTIEEDLERLEYFVNAPPLGEQQQVLAWQALTRIRASLAGMPHLEEGVRLLETMAGNVLALDGEDDAFTYEKRTRKWLEAERARQSRKGGE